MPIDSQPETYKHIGIVRALLGAVIRDLTYRQDAHDQSKLASPEREVFDEVTPKLAGLTYNSPEYKQALADMQPALDHHYANNSHHPEHYPDGIHDMSLIDLIEMLIDWKAATLRHNDGNFFQSILSNASRFGYSDELKQVFLNTVPFIEQAAREI